MSTHNILCQGSSLTRHFGAVRALDGVDIEIYDGELLGIIGPNGSGKTTMFNVLSGFLSPTLGRVEFLNNDITGWPAHDVSRLGLVRTFQQAAYFPSGSVAENIRLALRTQKQRSVGATVEELLEVTSLRDIADMPASLLSFGHLRLLGLGIALAGSPRLLLLDEPAAGLNDVEAEHFSATLRAIASTDITIAVVEHDMKFLLPLVDRVVVLDAGRTLAEGTPSEIRSNSAVIAAYLGEPASKGRKRRISRHTTEVDASPGLQVENLWVRYGGAEAVRGVDLDIWPGESVALLGPNGAGKTSLLRAISRLVPYEGEVRLFGRQSIQSPDRTARSGVGHVLEGRHVFAQLTVEENLLVSRLGRRKGFEADLQRICELFPALRDLWNRLGGSLSGGQQQMLVIARSLLCRPNLLILDEPSLGLSPIAAKELSVAIAHAREAWDTTLLVAEQSLALAADVADRYVVLGRGRIVHKGDFGSDESMEEVMRAYL